MSELQRLDGIPVSLARDRHAMVEPGENRGCSAGIIGGEPVGIVS